jgi:hypothetical protein
MGDPDEEASSALIAQLLREDFDRVRKGNPYMDRSESQEDYDVEYEHEEQEEKKEKKTKAPKRRGMHLICCG